MPRTGVRRRQRKAPQKRPEANYSRSEPPSRARRGLGGPFRAREAAPAAVYFTRPDPIFKWLRERPDILKTLRDEDEALTVQVSIDGQEHSIDVLRPVHGRDRLWVLYEESNLDAVTTYLRGMPFGDKQTHAELPDGVTGVIKRTNGWIVKKKRDDGSVQHMFTKQLDDATMLVNSDAGARDEH